MRFIGSKAWAVALGAAFLANTAIAAEPPADAAGLSAFLKAGGYKSWTREASAHPSQGPHPVRVIAYLNDALAKSLADGSPTHPKGAAAVKELYDASGKLSGWAASIKTSDVSDGGKGWFWYEVLSVEPGAAPVAAGKGVPLCFGCHTPGHDFVLIPFPFKN